MAEEKKGKKPVRPVTDEIATAEKDIDVFAGWIKRLENPDPTLRTEAKGKGLKLYDEVDRDPHAGSVLQTRYLALVGKDWEIIPAKSVKKLGRPTATPQEEHIAYFVRETLEGCNFNQARQEILQGILYGYYPGEVMWKIRNGEIRIKKIMGKHPRRFIFSLTRDLRLLTRQSMVEGEEVPDRKFIVFTYGDSDNPYGKGLGQKLWWPVWFKKHGIKYWLVFLEKFGMPTAVGKYPSGTDTGLQQKLMDAIDAIQNETGIKIPDDMAIDLLEASRQGKVTYETLCDYMDKQMSKAVLGQTASTEGTPGKLGGEEERGQVRQDILEADADLLDECLNETLIRWIVDYNFPGVTEYPKIKTHAERKPDLKERSEIDKTVASEIGVPVGKKYFYETYGIPEPAEDEEIVEPPSRGGGMPMGFAAKQGRLSPEQEQVEGLVEASVKNADRAMKGLERPVKQLIANAKSLDEIRDGLYSLYGEMDAKDMEELVARAMYVAELYGRSQIVRMAQSAERKG